MSKNIKFDEKMAQVKGISSDNTKSKRNVEFELSYKEIKHIRRILRAYETIYGRLYPKDAITDELTRKLYFKFIQFGKMKKSLNGESKTHKAKALATKSGRVCTHPGCKETEILTIDHIKKVSVYDDANKVENLQFLCTKHHLLKNLKSFLYAKNLQIDMLKKRIEDIEKKDTTDVLGFGVLSDKRFVDLEAEEDEKANEEYGWDKNKYTSEESWGK